MLTHDKLWKGELASHLRDIQGFHPAQNDPYGFGLEKAVQYSAFIIRKLIEDCAVTDRTKSRSLDINSSPSRLSKEEMWSVYLLGQPTLADGFDLDRTTPLRISYHDVSSEIIHADAFEIRLLDGDIFIQVCSYRNTHHRLLHINLAEFVTMIEQILDDRPVEWIMEKDLQTGRITGHAYGAGER